MARRAKGEAPRTGGRSREVAEAESGPSSLRDRATPPKVQGTFRDFVRGHERRRRLFPRALLVGIVTGCVAVAFRVCLEHAGVWLQQFVAWAHGFGWGGMPAVVALGAAGGWSAVWLTQRFAPEIAGSGIPYLKAVIHRLRPMTWWRVLPLKFLGGLLAIGSGMALGREGPTIQMGGACGQWIGRWTRSTARERRSLIAAGAGAGLAAAFNAPLAGVLFVLEEVQRDFSAALLAAAFVAAMAADIVARYFLGQSPLFHFENLSSPPLASLPWFILVGVACGVLGVLFNRGLLASLRLFGPLTRRGFGVSGLVAGAAGGVAVWFFPSAAGGGDGLLGMVWDGRLSVVVLGGFFVLRYFMTVTAYGSGAPGGIFAPMLVLGAILGSMIGKAGEILLPGASLDPTVLGVVGMAAFFASVVRGPLTAIVLIMEMTGGQEILLQLLVACFAAYIIAEALGERPIYEALLERDLARADRIPAAAESVLVSFTLENGARFVGRRLEEIGLPPGCLVVGVERSDGSIPGVPRHDTMLRSGDKISVLIDPTAEGAADALQAGMSRTGH
jgi:CIC family chloride channel protein